jgi:hypothetical protein
MVSVDGPEMTAGVGPQARPSRPLGLLFVKGRLAWPRASGHDVHCFHMMRALADLGHSISLATVERPAAASIEGLALARYECLAEAGAADEGAGPDIPLSRLQERLRTARTPGQWVRELVSLWSDAERRRRLGAAARRWVLEHHSWRAAAQTAATTLREARQARRER